MTDLSQYLLLFCRAYLYACYLFWMLYMQLHS